MLVKQISGNRIVSLSTVGKMTVMNIADKNGKLIQSRCKHIQRVFIPSDNGKNFINILKTDFDENMNLLKASDIGRVYDTEHNLIEEYPNSIDKTILKRFSIKSFIDTFEQHYTVKPSKDIHENMTDKEITKLKKEFTKMIQDAHIGYEELNTDFICLVDECSAGKTVFGAEKEKISESRSDDKYIQREIDLIKRLRNQFIDVSVHKISVERLTVKCLGIMNELDRLYDAVKTMKSFNISNIGRC